MNFFKIEILTKIYNNFKDNLSLTKLYLRILIIVFSFIFSSSFFPTIPEGFVYLKEIDDTIIVNLKYYSSSNFTGRTIDGYFSNEGILTCKAAEALKGAQKEFKKLGYSLVVFDAYRPQSSVDFFIEWSKDLNDTLNKILYYPDIKKADLFNLGYIAYKSGHSRGSTVDVSLIKISTNEQIDMGTIYDFFGIESSTYYSNISDLQKNNRMILYNVMTNNGFKNYSKEWWHYTLENEPYEKYYNFPVQ